ncbi:MAG: CpsD/CapB family tyrosine-protein kinase [Microgenomates group bacterium]
MEKIQSAIAKARATRTGPPNPVAGMPGSAPLPLRETTAANVPPAAAQVEAAWAALPALVPDAGQMARHRIVAFEGGREAVTFDVMRTRLLQQMRANNWRRLAITSPGAGCGKSMIALNLGFSLARQADLRTVVAELDLRRPSLAKTLAIREPHSFARVLEGTAKLEDNALRYGQNLIFSTNQNPFRNPAELLHSPSVTPVLADIEARYDPSLMIFDLPPLLVSDDAMAFVSHVDCVLLVAAAETSTIKEIDICERDLASQTNVLGVVLNKCRYTDSSYGYGYY